MWYYFGEGFLLGLSLGVYCFTACIPVILPYILAAGDKNFIKNLVILGEFVLGRLVAYLIFAFVVIFISRHYLKSPPPWMMSVLLTFCGLLMLSYFVVPKMRKIKFCRVFKPPFKIPILLGFVMGINACPPFIAAFARLLSIGSYVGGFLFFGGFFLSSSLFLLPSLLATPFLGERLKIIGKMTLMLIGAWYVFMGMMYWF